MATRGARSRVEKIDPSALEKQLRGSEPGPVYLVGGPEALLRDRAVKAIRDRVLTGEFADFNYRSYEPGGLDAAAVVEDLGVLPFGGGRRLVIIGPAEALSRESLKILGEYAADPSPASCLVLVAGEVKETLRKAFAGAVQVDCASPYQDRLPSHLAEEARRIGVKLEGAAANLLADWCGRDLTRAAVELRKAAGRVGPGGAVTERLVRDLIGGGEAGDIFRVASALARGDSPGAVRAARQYMESGDRGDLRVLYEMGMHLRRLLTARANLAAGMPRRDAIRAAGVFWKDADTFASSLDRWDERRITEAFRRLLEADRKVKVGLVDGEAAIESYLWATIGPPRGRGERRPGRSR